MFVTKDALYVALDQSFEKRFWMGGGTGRCREGCCWTLVGIGDGMEAIVVHWIDGDMVAVQAVHMDPTGDNTPAGPMVHTDPMTAMLLVTLMEYEIARFWSDYKALSDS